ncbi:polysaccharide deacetylase family protein [Actinoallomurus vinaceus]|uniref:Polysaccharide deacetylase family protein n=1 Tax=Actinoallomurus vinaceus TaxID=1080074 RepID=A0ABP8UVF1_9ACTN
MRFAGIAWTGEGYEVAVQGPGRPSTITFVPGQSGAVVDLLRSATSFGEERLAVVVDSTNGLLDGHLTAAGFDVHRADPWQLPVRDTFGSVGADLLAGLAERDLAALTRITGETGTLAGRIKELNAENARCTMVEQRLAKTGRFLTCAEIDHPRIALTFDDGPEPPFTGAILDILGDRGIHATFFSAGLNARAHPDLLARIAAEGHQVGNHSWSHPFIADLTPPDLAAQVEATGATIAEVCGDAPDLFRPPYGARTPDSLIWLAEAGMTTVLWSIDSGDWARPGPEAIEHTVLAGAANGSIVLMHDGGGDRSQTVAALPAVVAGLEERGFSLTTVEGLRSPASGTWSA